MYYYLQRVFDSENYYILCNKNKWENRIARDDFYINFKTRKIEKFSYINNNLTTRRNAIRVFKEILSNCKLIKL